MNVQYTKQDREVTHVNNILYTFFKFQPVMCIYHVVHADPNPESKQSVWHFLIEI